MKTIANSNLTAEHVRDRLNARSLSRLVLLLVLMASMTLAALPGGSTIQAPAQPWEIYRVDAPDYAKMLTDRTLRFMSDGTACMAFGGDQLYFACYDRVADVWSVELVDSDPMVGAFAALAINDQDHPYISYYDETNGDLKLAYKDALNTWQTLVIEESVTMIAPVVRQDPEAEPYLDAFDLPIYPTPLLAPADGDPFDWEGAFGVGKFTSIAIDRLNGIHISYYDDYSVAGSGMLKYAYWDGWNAPAITIIQQYHDQGDVGLWTSIAVDGGRNPHISYMSEKYDDLMYAYRRVDLWEIETVDTGDVGTYSSIALDSEGRPHISYFEFGSKDLRHAYRRGRDDWFLSLVDSNNAVGYFTSIAISNQNKIHISYYDATNGDLKYATTNFGDWNSWSKSVVASTGDTGYYTSIALRNANPSIFYFDLTEGQFRYARWDPDDERWVKRTLSDLYIADLGLSTSLALTSAGAPHISYMDDSRDYLKYAQAVSTVWETSFVTTKVHAGSWSSIAMLNDLQPAIAYYDMTNKDLALAIWDLTEWKFEKVQTENDVGQYVSMKIDSGGNYHISYYDATNQRLRYAYKDKDGDKDDWVITPLDTGGAGQFTSLALDPLDRPYISYYDASNERIMVTFRSATDTWLYIPVRSVGDPTDAIDIVQAQTSIAVLSYLSDIHIIYFNQTLGDLEYAYFDGVWHYETLDSAGNVGRYNSLAIHPESPYTRHVCYYDATNGDLKYAFWDGTLWNYEVVDSDGDVGLYCSIALNAAGAPAISYYDATMRDLKYATDFPLPDVQVHQVFVPIALK